MTPHRSGPQRAGLIRSVGVSQLKGSRPKVARTCTYRTKTGGPQSPGLPAPLWGLQESTAELQSYFDIGNHIRNGNSSDALIL